MGLKNSGGYNPVATGSRSIGKLIESFRGRDAVGTIRVNSDVRTNKLNLSPAAFDVSGGTEITSGDYKYHVFTSTGSLTLTMNPTGLLSPLNPDNSGNFDYLVIAGGGGGGATRADGNGGRGGGGAGGVRSNDPNYPRATPDTALTAPAVGTPYTYTVTVGSGGAAANLPGGPPPTHGGNGQNSSIIGPDHPGSGGAGGVVATGGGGGTILPNQASGEGGSGGGGAYGSLVDGTSVSSPDGLSPTLQGYEGNVGQGAGGGGGGAGGTSSPLSNNGGNGQAFPEYPGPVLEPGVPTTTSWSSVVGTPGTLAGGGAGGGGYSSSTGGGGGDGGGGSGSDYGSNNAPADPGVNYTGSGGGGGSGPASGNFNAGDGGNGIVIVRYKYQ